VLANPPLQEAVIASLERDFRIPKPLTIAVSAQGDAVTLRGTVETFRQRHAAIDDTHQIEGVREIDDQLRVELGPMDHRADDEIGAAAVQKLIRDPEVPDDSIEVGVRDGWVTLTGYVELSPDATRPTTTWRPSTESPASATKSRCWAIDGRLGGVGGG
jgi:osmotically-inducible protein OsmY